MKTTDELFEEMCPQDGVLPPWAKEFAIAFAIQVKNEALRAAAEDTIYNFMPDCKRCIMDAYPDENIK